MKSALTAATAMAVVLLAWPAFADEKAGTSAGPIARAAEREAARLASAEGGISSAARPEVRGEKSPPSEWSRVRGLERGAEIILTTAGSGPGRRYLLRADELGLTALNVTDPSLPGKVRDALIDAARLHPDYFVEAQRGSGSYRLNKTLRLSPEGAFAANLKVADLAQIIDNVQTNDVSEISVMAKHVGRHTRNGALVGGILGAALLGAASAGCSGPSECYNGAGMVALGGAVGLLYGGGIGAIVGAAAPRSPDVIYRAKK